MNKIKLMKTLIDSTKGKFFVVKFVKKDLTVRRMVCRLGVKKGLTGTGRTWEKENLITVYDVVNKGYRNVNLETIQSIKCGNVLFEENV